MIRQVKIAHDQAVVQRAAAMVTMKAMPVHAPDGLRHETAVQNADRSGPAPGGPTSSTAGGP